MIASIQTCGSRDLSVGVPPRALQRPLQASLPVVDSFGPRPVAVRSHAPVGRLPALPPEPLGPHIDRPQGPLKVRGVAFEPITLADLQPGDIGIDYRAEHRNLRQEMLAAGEGLQDLFRPNRRGSPAFMHAFLVINTYPGLGRVRVADASVEASPQQKADGLAPWGLSNTDLELADWQTKHAYHVFFRFKDPRMGSRMATIARNWTTEYGGNFRFYNAVRSVWHRSALDARSQARLLNLARSAGEEGPMRDVDGSPYQLMCSEFVANVAACAAMQLYVEDHPGVRPGDPETLRGLAVGPAGTLCTVDPASLSPSAMAGRLAADDQVVKVGHLYAES